MPETNATAAAETTAAIEPTLSDVGIDDALKAFSPSCIAFADSVNRTIQPMTSWRTGSKFSAVGRRINNIDEIDSSSYTTSIASSITNYKYENGRRYHAYQEGSQFIANVSVSISILVPI